MLSSSSLAAPAAASSELHPAEVSGLAKLFGQSAQGVYMNSSSLQCLGSWLSVCYSLSGSTTMRICYAIQYLQTLAMHLG